MRNWLETTGFEVSKKESLYMRGWASEQIEEHFNAEAEGLLRGLIDKYYFGNGSAIWGCIFYSSFDKALDEAASWTKFFCGRDMKRRVNKLINKYRKSDEIRNRYRQERFDELEKEGYRVDRNTGEVLGRY